MFGGKEKEGYENPLTLGVGDRSMRLVGISDRGPASFHDEHSEALRTGLPVPD
jgi:hypothetical protein